jgi:hypothetical protein
MVSMLQYGLIWSKLMHAKILVVVLLATFLSTDILAQGHYEATGEKTIELQRSSEYAAEGKEFEKVVPITMEYSTDACKADLSLEYFQKGANAHVKSTLSNEECGASSGDYTVRVKYKDSAGASQLVEFEEAWIRSDDADVVSEKDYPLGDDMDIVRVQSIKLSCHCEELQTQDQQPGDGESQ